jgi:hypothetical protein
VSSQEAKLVYAGFIAQAVLSRSVWSLQCCGDLVVLTGAEAGFFPLWPDLESARFCSAQHWPGLEPTRLALKALIRMHLGALAESRIPVGIGVAPHPEAVVLEASRLRRDLIAARALRRW